MESVPLSIRVPSAEADVYADSLLASGNVLIISTWKGQEELKPAARTLLEDFSAAGGTSLHLCLTRAADEFSYMCDRRSILALNRSNGGATLIQVIRKWSSIFLPSADELLALADNEALGNLSDVESRSNLLQQSYFYLLFSLLLFL